MAARHAFQTHFMVGGERMEFGTTPHVTTVVGAVATKHVAAIVGIYGLATNAARIVSADIAICQSSMHEDTAER